MRWLLVAMVIAVGAPAPAAAQPYVSCIDGHIVRSLAECPPMPRHGGSYAPTGGGPRSTGLLGLGIGGIL